MFNFIKYFNIYNYLIIGNQNIISTNNSLLYNNSGLSSIKKILLSIKNNFVSYQYCLRIKGETNDLIFNNDGIHQISFIMLGVFLKKKNLFNLLKSSLNYIFFILKIKKKKIFFTVNKKDFYNIIILLIHKINIKKIFLTKKNIWKIGKNGYFGFCIEIYKYINKKLLEIWNFVDIKYLKINNIIKRIKKNIIDSGLGYNRVIAYKKKNFKFFDICNTIYLIYNNINNNFKKNHNFILNKLIKIIFIIVINKKINIFKIFKLYFSLKNIFFYKNNKKEFIDFIIKKEFIFFKKIKNFSLINLNLKYIKCLNETHGFSYNYIFNIIKNYYK